MTPKRPRAAAPFSPVEATPPITRELLARLRALPQKPSRLTSPRNWPTALQSIADYVAQSPLWGARVSSRIRGYPRPFRRITFTSWDGTRLSAWLGVHRKGTRAEAREGVLLVPGLFIAKDNALHRARAVRLFRDHGYHVLALDLRGMGESDRVHSTAGWKESEDIEAALEAFRAHAPLLRLHVYAESLGASAAILAAARAADRGFRLVDGAVLAVSPFLDADRVVRHLDARRPLSDPFHVVQWFLKRLLDLRGQRYETFRTYLRDAARAHRIPPRELLARASARAVVRRVRDPLLILAANDDPLVPRRDLDELQAVLGRRINPGLMRLAWGGHCLFELLDRQWFWSLLREYYGPYGFAPARRARPRRPPK